jgi:hypothetical protein
MLTQQEIQKMFNEMRIDKFAESRIIEFENLNKLCTKSFLSSPQYIIEIASDTKTNEEQGIVNGELGRNPK